MRGRIPLGVLAGAALVIALGVAGALWAQSGGSAGDTARLVPADTAVYITVNTDAASRQWVQMSQLLGRLDLVEPLKEARNSGLAFAELDWEDDIAPFLGGEATVAVTNASGRTPEAVVIFSTSDGNRAWKTALRAMAALSEDSGAPKIRTYRGAEIRTYAAEDFPVSISVAHKDRYLIFATSAEGAQSVLDLAAGEGKALSGSGRFRAARAAMAADPLMFVYVNPTAAVDLAEGITSLVLGSPAFGSPRDALRQAGMENAAFAFAASAERTGMRFEWQTVGIDGSKTPVVMTAAPDESRFARRAPADTLVFLNGINLWSIYQGAMTALDRAAQEPEASEFVEAIRDEIAKLKRELGFDVERELLAHFTGEYAFALGATGFGDDNLWAAGMSAVADPAAVSRSLQGIAAYERRQGRKVSTTTVGGVSVTESRPGSSLDDDDVWAYGVAGDELLVGFGAGALRNVITPRGALADSADYREALAMLPKGRALTMFVNTARLIELIREDSGAFGGETLNWQALSRLRYLAMAMHQSADRSGGVAILRVAGE